MFNGEKVALSTVGVAVATAILVCCFPDLGVGTANRYSTKGESGQTSIHRSDSALSLHSATVPQFVVGGIDKAISPRQSFAFGNDNASLSLRRDATSAVGLECGISDAASIHSTTKPLSGATVCGLHYASYRHPTGVCKRISHAQAPTGMESVCKQRRFSKLPPHDNICSDAAGLDGLQRNRENLPPSRFFYDLSTTGLTGAWTHGVCLDLRSWQNEENQERQRLTDALDSAYIENESCTSVGLVVRVDAVDESEEGWRRFGHNPAIASDFIRQQIFGLGYDFWSLQATAIWNRGLSVAPRPAYETNVGFYLRHVVYAQVKEAYYIRKRQRIRSGLHASSIRICFRRWEHSSEKAYWNARDFKRSTTDLRTVGIRCRKHKRQVEAVCSRKSDVGNAGLPMGLRSCRLGVCDQHAGCFRTQLRL